MNTQETPLITAPEGAWKNFKKRTPILGMIFRRHAHNLANLNEAIEQSLKHTEENKSNWCAQCAPKMFQAAYTPSLWQRLKA
jgi:hypothetical protein